MKRATKILLVSAVLLVLFAGVAVAATFTCTKVNCPGTPQRDVITGGGANQLFNAKAGNDDVFGKAGDDRINGEAGNDNLVGELGCDRVDGGTNADFIDIATGDNCSRSFTSGNREQGIAKDNLPNDEVDSTDNRPDEIRCDNGDALTVDAQIDLIISDTGSGFAEGDPGEDVELDCGDEVPLTETPE